MMAWTDRHQRYFMRLISRHALLYTEMVTTGAIIHGDTERFLARHEAEHPVALQLGGSEPKALADCAVIAQAYGYDEINLNVGCPSDRVQSGRFGACLMAEPNLVADCVAAMQEKVNIPVTVKCRIGIDEQDENTALQAFIEPVAQAGCTTFIVHARKAWLKGLSPKENRDIPPLRYPLVHQIKRENPALNIVINGGIETLDDAVAHLQQMDGVMIGRAAYQNPALLLQADSVLFNDASDTPSRHDIVERYLPYIEAQLALAVPLHSMTRHILGLFQGCAGAKRWRRYLSENSHKPQAGPEVVRHALALVPDTQATAAA